MAAAPPDRGAHGDAAIKTGGFTMRRRKSRLGLILALTLGLSVAVPAAAQARTLYATTSHGQLLSFPDRATKVKGHKKSKKYVRAKTKRTITGLPSGVRLVGIDSVPRRASCSVSAVQD
jgi:hypothetical protein